MSDTTVKEQEWLVQASPPFPKETLREDLSEVDEWQSRSQHWLSFSLRFDTVLDIDVVRVGLERTLGHIPALGARVDTTNSNLYQLVLEPGDNNQGVVLEYLEKKCSDDNLPNDSNPRGDWTKAGLEGPPAGYSGEPTLADPLMRAKLVVYPRQQVSYLCIGISHGLCDGTGVCDVLHVWSHFCHHDSVDGLPESLRRPRAFGQRVTTPYRPAQNKRDLLDRLESEVGCSRNPLSAWTFYGHVVPRAIWVMGRQQLLEVRINESRLQALKQEISSRLPKGQWVSRFEVLSAALIVAQRATSGTLPEQHTLHVACDLRGRAERFPTDYFGNAAFDFHQPIELPSTTTYDIDTLVTVAQVIHTAVRTGLTNPEDVCITKDWYEAARHLGIKNKYDVWAPVVLDALTGNGTFVNSWGRRWMDISMGSSSQTAVAMAVFFGMLQNLLIEVPRHRDSGDSTVYLALPGSHAKRFVEFCTSNEKKETLPFSVVESEE